MTNRITVILMNKINSKEQATKVIESKLSQAQQLFRECAKIAEEHDVYFHTSILGLYGSGASYYPPEEDDDGLDEYGDEVPEDQRGWSASGGSC